MKEKLRLIFFPFLMLGLLFMGGYTLLNWLLFIKLELINLNDFLIEFALPIGIVCILVAIHLRPTIKLLKFTHKSKEYPFFYLIVAIAVIAIPTVIAQNYLAKATGKLTELTSMSSIGQEIKTKYYHAEKYHVSKREFVTHSSVEVKMASRHREELIISLYITMPIYDSYWDEAFAGHSEYAPSIPAWLGIKYSTTIDNSLSEMDKQKEFEEFLRNSQKEFDENDVQQSVFFERIGSSSDLDGYREAIKNHTKFNSVEAIVLVPHNIPFESRTGNQLRWIFLSYGMGILFWLGLLIFSSFDEKKLQLYRNQPDRKSDDWQIYLSFFKPTGDYFITPFIVDLNIIVLLVFFLSTGTGLISYRTADLVQWGANYSPYINQGEYWRLLLSTFLHGGALHLMGNMFFLTLVGTLLEPILGRIKFLLAYIATGVVASFTSFCWSGEVSVGASGAVLGLYGLYLTLLYFPRNSLSELKAIQWDPLAAIPVIVFAGGLVMPNIDNAAHLGGLLSGSLIALLLIFLTGIKYNELNYKRRDRGY